LFRNLAAFMGIDENRIHFSWISSAESTKFVKVVSEITEKVRALGPNQQFVKNTVKVA
jgi:coenzyme F420-reducing hydrogenase delta subunit